MPADAHANDVPDVPELLKRHQQATGEKQSDIVARATKAGFTLSRQTVSKLARGPKESPKSPETIRALAAGLRVTEKVVWLAFGKSLGLAIDQADLADRIPPSADDLPEEVQDALLMLMRAIARSAPVRRVGDLPPLPGEHYYWPEEAAPSGRRNRLHKIDETPTKRDTRL